MLYTLTMERISLEKPKLTLKDRKNALQKFSASNKSEQRRYFLKLMSPKYLYWDKAKHYSIPHGLTPEESWTAIRAMRTLFSRDTFLLQENGEPFTFLTLPESEKWHHRIDTAIGGNLFASFSTFSEQKKQKFLMNGIIEEAIASSQLEGANTSRKVAKKMILEKREPRNKGERMIINNYRAMQLIEEDYKNKELSVDFLLELHRIISDRDNDIPQQERGRFRTDEDEVVVVDSSKQMIAHIAPNSKFMNKEILRLITYANDQDGDVFTHPIIKAIFLHFWIGYLHPFTDGNGRIARALFYWYLLKKGYWGVSFLPISKVIKKSPIQYGKAYIYTEQDDGDLTYFYDYHIRKIMIALDEFDAYVKRKIIENKEIDKRVGKDILLNDRQKQLLHYLLSEDDSFTTMTSYGAIYNVSRVTALKDLSKLENAGYLTSKRIGKERRYYLTEKIR